jgi:hypothetical protein
MQFPWISYPSLIWSSGLTWRLPFPWNILSIVDLEQWADLKVAISVDLLSIVDLEQWADLKVAVSVDLCSVIKLEQCTGSWMP